jgi:hypothetical protein
MDLIMAGQPADRWTAAAGRKAALADLDGDEVAILRQRLSG